MTHHAIYLGATALNFPAQQATGTFVTFDGTEYYKISHYDRMLPFLISVVSDSDHWMYISSRGGLSAGRKNPENALFPYYTDDKIDDGSDLTGSKTLLLVAKGGKTYLWEPFSDHHRGVYTLERNLYKNISGNQLIFEEVNQDLGLTFSYGWYSSEQYGFVKKSRLVNSGGEPVQVRLLDGLQNLLPYGVDLKMQTERSNLLDAYKKNELLAKSGLGLFLMSSIPVDKAEPSEALKATTVWSVGLPVSTHLLSAVQLNSFRQGLALEEETNVRAERGAYFVESTLQLAAGASKTWYFAAEINQGPAAVVALADWIEKDDHLAKALETDIAAGTRRLLHIVASADGLQKSTDKMLTARHFGNVLFNVMRGGIFDHNFSVHKNDLQAFVAQFNRQVAAKHADFFQALPAVVHYADLLQAAAHIGDTQLQRLCLEYLPLTFSRRHGDPSRPWNRFSIELFEETGEKKLYYEGNWRDIFQNWEALALAYPRFLESMISKFVNASTADGYNPYRVTRNGIDWEVIEPEDPWSYIGYWGDHQIIYLLKLLELSRAHHPGALEGMLSQRLFAYANVPYRIRPYEKLLADPQDTVDFDHHLEEKVGERVAAVGADGKLVWDTKGEVYLVNLTEKLLVTLLAKLSNFIPEGGIWLNTQRPEWNDANNALVGNGVSMVTLYYIRRFVTFCQSLFGGLEQDNLAVSAEVAELFQAIATTFDAYQSRLVGPLDDDLRRQIVDKLGLAGETYRNQVYQGFSEKSDTLSLPRIQEFFTLVLAFTDHTIRANQRPDALYHSYNLMKVSEDGGIAIRHLYEMLEGQVAVLSAGLLSPAEVIAVLEALRDSQLYRADQHSYILYPDRQLPRFDVKNNLPGHAVEKSKLLMAMVTQGDQRLIEKDVRGQYHFNGNFHNQKDVLAALHAIDPNEYGPLTEQEIAPILALFETVFDHQSFTGRSGTFFGYEGLGSIYWHMVSKLLLAVEENCWQAIQSGADPAQIKQLIAHYYDIRAGLGTHKTPDNYGAFPADPYSHTPGNAGAQQPGMTGQVKEDILARFGELGIFVEDGQICCRPDLLQQSEFLGEAEPFVYVDVNDAERKVTLPAGSLAFTYCQVLFIYRLADQPAVRVQSADGTLIHKNTTILNYEVSSQIMNRTGEVVQVEVDFKLG